MHSTHTCTCKHTHMHTHTHTHTHTHLHTSMHAPLPGTPSTRMGATPARLARGPGALRWGARSFSVGRARLAGLLQDHAGALWGGAGEERPLSEAAARRQRRGVGGGLGDGSRGGLVEVLGGRGAEEDRGQRARGECDREVASSQSGLEGTPVDEVGERQECGCGCVYMCVACMVPVHVCVCRMCGRRGGWMLQR